MSQQGYPPGWDEERVKRVLAHYEQQSEEEAVAEDEAAFEKDGVTSLPNNTAPGSIRDRTPVADKYTRSSTSNAAPVPSNQRRGMRSPNQAVVSS